MKCGRSTNADGKDILAVSATPNGDLLAGASNAAALYLVHARTNGNVYRTAVRDAGAVTVWGHLRWTGDQPAGLPSGFSNAAAATAACRMKVGATGPKPRQDLTERQLPVPGPRPADPI